MAKVRQTLIWAASGGDWSLHPTLTASLWFLVISYMLMCMLEIKWPCCCHHNMDIRKPFDTLQSIKSGGLLKLDRWFKLRGNIGIPALFLGRAKQKNKTKWDNLEWWKEGVTSHSNRWFLVSACAAEPVYLIDSRYQWLYLLRNCFSPLKAFIFFSGIISVLNIATVIIEVLVAPIMDCLTATSGRMSHVSDWSSHLGDHWCDHWQTLNAVLPNDNSVFFPEWRLMSYLLGVDIVHNLKPSYAHRNLHSAGLWTAQRQKMVCYRSEESL